MGLTIFDIDGVLTGFTREIFIPCAEEVLGITLPKDYIPKEWSYAPLVGDSKTESKVWASSLMNKYILAAKPLPHALEVIQNNGSCIFITSRGTNGDIERQTVTRQWLDNLGLAHIKVYFAHSSEKVKLALELGATVAWEDYPRTVLDYADNGIHVFMPEYGYNSGVNHPLVFHVLGWDYR